MAEVNPIPPKDRHSLEHNERQCFKYVLFQFLNGFLLLGLVCFFLIGPFSLWAGIVLSIFSYTVFNSIQKVLDRHFSPYYSQRNILIMNLRTRRDDKEQKIYEQHEKFSSQNDNLLIKLIRLVLDLVKEIKSFKGNGLKNRTGIANRKASPRAGKNGQKSDDDADDE